MTASSNGASDIEVAVIGGIAVLVGAAVAFLATMLTNHANRKSELGAVARSSIEWLQEAFADFQTFVVSGRSIKKSGPSPESVLAAEWQKKYSSQARLHNHRVPSRRARRAIAVFIDTLDRARALHSVGDGLEDTPRQEMWAAAGDGFDLASALLQRSSLPARSLRRARRLRRQLNWLYRMWSDDLLRDQGKTPPSSGVVRALWRKSRRRSVSIRKMIARPFVRFGGMLFRP